MQLEGSSSKLRRERSSQAERRLPRVSVLAPCSHISERLASDNLSVFLLTISKVAAGCLIFIVLLWSFFICQSSNNF